MTALGIRSGSDLTRDVEGDADASQADILALLARVERDHPELAAVALDREVDSLLGRKPAPAKLARIPKPRAPRGHSESSAFSWYQHMVAALPPVMSTEETIAAARAVEIGLFAEERLDGLNRARVTRMYVRDLHALIEEGKAAFRQLIVSNLRLVFYWSKGVASSLGEQWAQDAFQAGCIGLIRGLQRWDYTKGYTLSTYVSWHIRQQIQRWRWNEVALIRLPVHVWQKLESESCDLSAEVEADALRAQNIVPLDELNEDDPALVWDDGLEAIPGRPETFRIVSKLLGLLSEREADVLKLRYGLGDLTDEPMTLDTIGQIFGVSRERIRQIESKAIKALQKHPLAKELAELL